MASNQTKNYQLNQWEASDPVLREDFNSDNAKIDAALGDLAGRNCQFYTLTYTGTGEGGRSFTFPHRPMVVLVMGGVVTFMCAIQGASYIYLRYGISVSKSKAVWEGNTLTWSLSEDSPTLSANTEGQTYVLMALLDANS